MPEKGILVVELKGWREENILRIENNDSVIIQTNDGEVSASPQKQARGYRFSIERHIRRNIGKFPLVYQMVCLPQVSKAFFKSHRLDVVMEEKFTILKEDLKDKTSFFNKLDQALREVCHWNRNPFDRRTMLEVRNLFEIDINVDEDGESEIEKELASSYHRHDYSRFYYFNEFDQMSGNTINDNVKEIVALKDLCRENDIPIESFQAAYKWEDFKKNSDGMVPVIVQDYRTQEVLMMAYMNEEAYEQTLKLGKMTYYSRSRQELWLKGLTSGHYQYVKELVADCDMDTILAKVSQVGAACHTGSRSCFFNEITKKDYEESSNPLQVFEEVFDVIKDRKVHPKEGSYTNYLFDKGIDKILKKLGEEATEIVIAAKNPNPNEVKYEISDFLYHMMVLMAEKDVTWEEITTELANR